MAKRKGPKKKLKLRKRLERQVSELFADNPSKSLNYKQVAARLNVKDSESRRLIIAILGDLRAKSRLIEVEPGKYKLRKDAMLVVEGVADFTRTGSAYVISEDVEEDIFVPNRSVGTAFPGDLVRVRISSAKRSTPKGEIVSVVKRTKERFVGVFQKGRHEYFAVPNSEKINVDFIIPKDKILDAKDGQKVLVRLLEWDNVDSNPVAEVIEVLGYPGEPTTEAHSILADFGLPHTFPPAVESAADKIEKEISNKEISNRKDIRDITTFTIDPSDAKDFDDAISFRELEKDKYEIGVHIADVSHYVTEGSEIDKEAVERATSVYLVDRVIPMLPEVLSNDICSLKPNVDRLCFSVIFQISANTQITNYWIGRTVIHSDRRFTYEEVQEIIEGKPGDFSEEIKTINNLAVEMRKNRIEKGAIAFDKTEVKFKIDKDGQPEGVLFKVQKEAHKLIEEFMLLANRTVAEHIGKKSKKPKTFVYRVHDSPDPVKISEFANFIKKFGYHLRASKGGNISQSLNSILHEIKGKGEQNMISQLAIRTMAKAVYTTDNIGHYGLGFNHYTHFTSPIRRYPDVIVHRLLDQYLNGGSSANEDQIEQLCKHSSDMEKKATDAERESTKFFQVLFLKDSVGELFDGVVSGVSEWGIYVEININKCEGMVRLRDIEGDYFSFDEENYRVVGRKTGLRIQLGDPVRIQVKHVDLVNKRIDFALIEKALM